VPLAAHSNYTGGGNGEAVFIEKGVAADSWWETFA
jgi:hypothetical protein